MCFIGGAFFVTRVKRNMNITASFRADKTRRPADQASRSMDLHEKEYPNHAGIRFAIRNRSALCF